MNRGRHRGFSSGGYTIVETLIFLAVSSAILITAIMLIGGQQSRTQFQSDVRGFESKLVDIANDVATGYYRNAGGTKECVETANGPQFSGANTPLGMNQKCVFIGTVIKFGDGGTDGGDRFVQFTMAGLRQSGGNNVLDLVQAKPQVLDNGGGFEPNDIGTGIRVSCIRVGADTNPCDANNAAIGFFTTFEGASLTGEGGGAVQADVINYGSVTIDQNANSAKGIINAFNTSTPGYGSTTLNRQITLCLIGGSNQYALVRLGGDASSNLAVSSEIKEGTSCN